jgi:hypothetical protein
MSSSQSGLRSVVPPVLSIFQSNHVVSLASMDALGVTAVTPERNMQRVHHSERTE